LDVLGEKLSNQPLGGKKRGKGTGRRSTTGLNMIQGKGWKKASLSGPGPGVPWGGIGVEG